MKSILFVGLVGLVTFVAAGLLAPFVLPSHAEIHIVSATPGVEVAFDAHLRDARGETILQLDGQRTPFETKVAAEVEGEITVQSPGDMVTVEVEVRRMGQRKIWGHATGTHPKVSISHSRVAFAGQ